MTNQQTIDWTALGLQMRQASLDAHEEIVPIEECWDFVQNNPEIFQDWFMESVDLPSMPPFQTVDAYYTGDRPEIHAALKRFGQEYNA